MTELHTPVMRVLMVGGPANGTVVDVPGDRWDVRVLEQPEMVYEPGSAPDLWGPPTKQVVYTRTVPCQVVDGAVVFTRDGKPSSAALEFGRLTS